MCSASTPRISICFNLAVCPDTIQTEDEGRPSALAMSRSSAVLAAPSTGGAATLTFR